MLKANELRIGNLINNEFKKPICVSFDTLQSIHYKRNMFYTPIKLTDDWLIDNGFYPVKIDNDEYYYQNHKFRLNSNYTGFYYSRNLTIKYVHQLQNLYFALTGEEIQVNAA